MFALRDTFVASYQRVQSERHGPLMAEETLQIADIHSILGRAQLLRYHLNKQGKRSDLSALTVTIYGLVDIEGPRQEQK